MRNVLVWLKDLGGLDAIEQRNRAKAAVLYAAIDAHAGFYRCPVERASRSVMNVVFRLPSEALEKRFVAEAKKAGMVGLKGHRSVGGIRVSLYNAVEPAWVDTLACFMNDFMKEALAESSLLRGLGPDVLRGGLEGGRELRGDGVAAAPLVDLDQGRVGGARELHAAVPREAAGLLLGVVGRGADGRGTGSSHGGARIARFQCPNKATWHVTFGTKASRVLARSRESNVAVPRALTLPATLAMPVASASLRSW